MTAGRRHRLPGAEPASAGLRWPSLLALIVFAALARGLAYSGYFGSDEVTYTAAAFALLDGDWRVSDYVGANRYGVNLPVAGFGWLLGRNEIAAAAYSLLCSLAEVGLVAWIGARMLGARAGLLAGLVLASLPIHVHFAGRLMADAPFALAATASFLFFWVAERPQDRAAPGPALAESRRRSLAYFIAGLAAGWSFWIKPTAIFYLGVFLSYPLLVRRIDLRWAWMALGFALMLVANGLFFQALTGRFWFALENIAERQTSGYLEAGLSAGSMHFDPGFYLGYLFGRVYHTGLLGPLALAALGLWLWRGRRRAGGGGLTFVVWWGVGLLLVLSVLVVSVSPLMLVPKQTNYMLIFVAPLALLAGHALASASGWRQALLTTLTVVPALGLCLLLQAGTTVFTANSKGIHRYALERPGVAIYTHTNGLRFAQFQRLVNPGGRSVDVRAIGQWNAPAADAAARPAERLAIVDPETIAWANSEPFRSLAGRPPCWVAQGGVVPVIDGLGPRMADALAGMASALPGGEGVAGRLHRLAQPLPAQVFRIPAAGC